MSAATYEGEALSWRLVDAVLEVRLHRAPANEIGTAALAEIERLAALVAGGELEDLGARALLWYSDVPAGFSAGADLRELYRGLAEGRAEGVPRAALSAEIETFIGRVHHAFDVLDMAPVTTIAAIHGVCFGGGFELALTADVLVADRRARFAFPELRLGLVPGFGGLPRLGRDAGNATIRDLLLTGRSVRATRAHALGVVAHLAAPGESLATARSLAAQAARYDPTTVRAAKAFAKPLPAEALARERALFCELIQSPTVEAALARFVEDTGPMPYL